VILPACLILGPALLEWTEPPAPKTASGERLVGDETNAHWIADHRTVRMILVSLVSAAVAGPVERGERRARGLPAPLPKHLAQLTSAFVHPLLDPRLADKCRTYGSVSDSPTRDSIPELKIIHLMEESPMNDAIYAVSPNRHCRFVLVL